MLLRGLVAGAVPTLLLEFGSKALRRVQAAMATGSWLTDREREQMQAQGHAGTGWCRRVVNRMTTRVKTMWHWAVLEELGTEAQEATLYRVRGLAEGEHGVRETADVPPVPEADLATVLPHLSPIPRLLVDALLLTGARPSELLRLTPADLNRSGSVEVMRSYHVPLGAIWCAQPTRHKTAHKGHRRVVLLGPRLQALLLPWLAGRAPDRPIFSPAESEIQRRAQARAHRKTRVQPSQQDRRRIDPARKPGEVYTCSALNHALGYACAKAGVPHFSPYRLRHNAATRLLEEFGPDVARVILGHKTFNMLPIYAVDALKKAAEAVGKVG